MDPYHTHFPAHIRTGMYVKGQIDYILMDTAMEWLVVRVGYLALYKGVPLDHIYTSLYVKGHIDYILMDAAMEWLVVKVGYLALYKGATVNHSYTYTDFEDTKLVQRIIYHPVDIQS